MAVHSSVSVDRLASRSMQKIIILLLIGMLLALPLSGAGSRTASAQAPVVFTHSAVVDFAGCSALQGTSVSNVAGGEVRLAALLEDYFDGASVNTSKWVSPGDPVTQSPQVSNGVLIVDSDHVSSTIGITSQDLPVAIEAYARMAEPGRGTGWGDIGLGKSSQVGGPPNVYFITDNSGNTYVNSYFPGASSPQRNVINGFTWTDYHTFRFVLDTNRIDYYVDGVYLRSHTLATPMTMPMYLWLYTNYYNYDLAVDWVRVARYPASGTFTSCTMDAGASGNWSSLAWQGETPSGGGVSFETRTSLDGVSWSAWSALGAQNSVTSPAGRYLQYRANLTTTDRTLSPQINSVDVTFSSSGQATSTPTDTPTNTPGATATATSTAAASPTATSTSAPTNTPTATPTNTTAPVNTATNTPAPTNTPTNPPAPTATSTATTAPAPSATATPNTSGVFAQTLVGDFASCGPITGASITDMNGGEIRLAAALEDYFSSAGVNSALWDVAQPYQWFTPVTQVANGLITLDGGGLRSVQSFSQDVRVFEARARLADPRTAFGDIGFGGNGSQPPADTTRLFLTNDTGTLQTNVRDGSTITRTNFTAYNTNLFHDYRIVARQNQTEFYVNGQLIRTDANQSMLTTWAWLFTLFPGYQIQVDWARVALYPSTGAFTSCALDAGGSVNWGTLDASGQVPAGTAATFETRTSQDGQNWSAWQAVAGNSVLSPDGRYLQYRVNMTTNDVTVSPQIDEILVALDGVVPTATPTNTPTTAPTNTPTPLPTNTPTPTPLPTNTFTPTATSTPDPNATATATPTPMPTATPTNTSAPVTNSALAFDGIDDIVFANAVAGTGPFTVEAWVRPNNNNATGLLVVNAGNNSGWSLELEAGAPTLWVSTSQGWQFVRHTTTLAAGQWYHVAATDTGSQIRLFVNGVPSAIVNVGTLTQGTLLRFGGLSGFPYFAGTLDEVRISNVVRYTDSFTPSTSALSTDANTLGLWSFDEGSGQTTADESATGNTGTLGTSAGADVTDPVWTAGYGFVGGGSTPVPTSTPGPTSTPTSTPTATPTTVVVPGSNNALLFDGIDDIVSASSVSGVGPLTIEAWVRPAANGEEAVLVANAGGNSGWSLELNSGLLSFWVSTSQGWQVSRYPTGLVGGQWYHVVAVYSANQIRTFVNGVPSSWISTGTLTQGSVMRIGGLSGYSYLAGAMDEVRISNVERYTAAFTVPSGGFVSDANTLALWSFDEGAGQVTADESAAANTATLGSTANIDGDDPTWEVGQSVQSAARSVMMQTIDSQLRLYLPDLSR